MDQLRSPDDRHTVLQLEIQFLKEKIRQIPAELSVLRRALCIFMERFDEKMHQEVQRRLRMKQAFFTLMREVRESIDNFLEHDVGHDP